VGLDRPQKGRESEGWDSHFLSFHTISHIHFFTFLPFPPLTASLIVLTFTVFFDAGTGPPV